MASQATSFIGRVRGGRLAPSVRADISAHINRLDDGDYEVTVSPVRRPPTAKQRGYYFPVVCKGYGEFAGMTKNETHYAFKLALLGVDNPDLPLPRVRSITTLTPGEFVHYVDDCIVIAAQMGCPLPPPDPAWRAQGFRAEMEWLA